VTPQLGKLPRPAGKSAAPLLPIEAVAPVRPAEVHNIELDAADTDMYGNGVWGDCVFVMIEKDRVISAEALGVPITKLTPAEVIRNYCDYNGIGTNPNVDAPGPGAVILDALKWAQNHPERFGGSHLLFYGDLPLTEDAFKSGVAEFASVCVGVVVYKAMEYPERVWYTGARGPQIGGHGVAGGTYTGLADFLKTWGYMVSVNANGFATIDELVVCVWDFQWRALSYARQLECIAAYQFYTGRPWHGPAAVPPQEVVMVQPFALKPVVRMIDTRIGLGLSGKFQALVSRRIQVAGVNGVPANASVIRGNLTVTNQTSAGYLSCTSSDQTGQKPPISSINFPVGDNRANFIECPLDATGGMWVTYVAPARNLADVLFDPSSGDIPAAALTPEKE
jgi:hypothetical protein